MGHIAKPRQAYGSPKRRESRCARQVLNQRRQHGRVLSGTRHASCKTVLKLDLWLLWSVVLVQELMLSMCAQEVELAVREYDSEVAERHQELMQEQAAYDDLCSRMKVRPPHNTTAYLLTDSDFFQFVLKFSCARLRGRQIRAGVSSECSGTYRYLQNTVCSCSCQSSD